MRSLDLSDSQITDVGLGSLRGLGALEELRLPRGVTDAGLAQLAHLTELKVLELRRARVTGVGLRGFQTAAKLEEVVLSRARVTPEGRAAIRELETALPGLKVGLAGGE